MKEEVVFKSGMFYLNIRLGKALCYMPCMVPDPHGDARTRSRDPLKFQSPSNMSHLSKCSRVSH